MKKSLVLFTVVLMATLVGACNKKMNKFSGSLNKSQLLADVETQVNFGPRPAGSAALAECAQWLEDTIKGMGVAVKQDRWDEATADGNKRFINVEAEIAGNEPGFIILASHFDTKLLPGQHFVGANDAGSSTALLLELIRYLKVNYKAGPTLKFLFFDGEECVHSYTENDGLHGSKRVADRIFYDGQVKDCQAMILMDMVGDKDLHIQFTRGMSRSLIDRVLELAEAAGYGDYFSYSATAPRILDDHEPFFEKGIDAIDFIDFNFGPHNSYWHTEADRLDKISGESMAIVGEVVLMLLDDLTGERL